jgi:hypothetical protein
VHERREVRVEAHVIRASLAFAFAWSTLACNTPPKEAHDGATIPLAAASAAPVAPASASASTSASAHTPASASAPTAPPATSTSCAKDDECRTVSSYCAEAPCACRVVSARDPDPKCLGAAASNVRCFADPCMNKAARCQGGACVLTAK